MHGQATQSIASQSADFGYAGMYFHAPSGLNLATYRAYNPSLGRWINRDPIGESGGANLYQYAINRPTSVIDPTGLIMYPATPQGISDFARDAGLSAGALGGGCRDVVNQVIGLPPGYINPLRDMGVTPHIAKNDHERRTSSIDNRTTRHDGYDVIDTFRSARRNENSWSRYLVGARRSYACAR